MKKIGVLALQGCVQPHRAHVEAAGHEFVEIRKPQQLKTVDALIIPGGESTTFLKLLSTFGFFEALEEFKESKKPAWGICAGAILISEKILNSEQKSCNWIPMTVSRNAYGRQLESFETKVWDYSVAFIRAPQFESFAEGVEILAHDPRSNKPSCVRFNQFLATSFHPELSTPTPSPFHQYFFEMVEAASFPELTKPSFSKSLFPQTL